MRRWLDACLGVLLVLLVAVGGVRWADWAFEPVVTAQALGPFVVIALTLLFAGTLLLRRWWMLVPVGLCAAVAWAIALPTFFAHTAAGPATFTVMAVNLDRGRGNADQVMAAVEAHDVDVLVLTEVTPDAVDRLAAAGLTRRFDRHTGAAHADADSGTMIYTRLPMTIVSGTGNPALEQTPKLQPEVVLDVDGSPVRLKAVHPVAPVGSDAARWRAGLRALDEWKRAAPPGERLILAGDFDAGFGHPGFRALAAGLVDAQREAGQGWVRTWPVVGRRMPPFVALDHLLSRRLGVAAAGQVAFHGSDHMLVWASYTLR